MKINFKMRIDIFVEGVRLFSVFHALLRFTVAAAAMNSIVLICYV